MLSFFISSTTFVMSVLFINRFLDAHGLEKEMARNILVGIVASILAYLVVILCEAFNLI